MAGLHALVSGTMAVMDAASVNLLREVLASTGWVERTRELGLALRATRSAGGLLVVGTPEDEPWHVTAHLADEARLSGFAQLSPTLVRWAPPPGAQRAVARPSVSIPRSYAGRGRSIRSHQIPARMTSRKRIRTAKRVL